ncbi:MAG TPA: hypothetical protein VL334_26450 [Anaerolineae bacterium]|nr:hypothetical protein [Anaerolineae bacterium]
MPTEDDRVVLNGIDAETGAPLVDPMDLSTLAAIIKGQPVDRTQARDLTAIAQLHNTPTLGLPDGVSPTDVSKAGWAVVLHKDEDPLVRRQLERLVEHRRGQIQDDSRVKVLEYADEPDWKAWLAKYRVGVGNVFPQRVPYYLLLVGGPERIPFEFGQMLSLEYAVGLLHFDSVDGYRQYVDSLIAYETGAALPRRKEAVFFRTQERFDRATKLSALNLVQPLADGSPGLLDDMDKPVTSKSGFATGRVWDDAATRPALAEIFAPPAASDPAAFLFTASHGLGFRQPHPEQPAIQGALKCQDNAGFSAQTLAETPGVRVHGLVAFFFACYGAGTPREEQYLREVDQPPPVLADKPFIAALPKALLSHPQGGALACIGHIERAWNYSFIATHIGEQITPYWNAVRRILDGLPVGYALKDMRERYATLSTGLSQTLWNMRFGLQPTDQELVTAWAERNDAGGYVVIGDPAVRLRLDTLVA